MSPALERLDVLVRDVIAPRAASTDAERAFPTHAVDALREADLLGLTVGVDAGGLGGSLADAAAVVERIARACGSSAMVVCMHYCGAAVVEAHGDRDARRAATRGLLTLAFSEAGSRSHFWAPTSTARPDGASVRLRAHKSWVTSAHHADYVWSSRPAAADGPSTLWLVPGRAPGLTIPGPFDGLGLRGNDSTPIVADDVRVPLTARLGPDGGGFDVMMGVVLPTFTVLNAACSIGLMEGVLAAAGAHVGATRHEHLGTSLADLPTIRAQLGRMRVRVDQARALWTETIAALAERRPDAMLRVLSVKASAGEAALEVTQAAMRVCGGAAYRGGGVVERGFRDAQAASVMAPTTDQLHDFLGKAVAGLPLF